MGQPPPSGLMSRAEVRATLLLLLAGSGLAAVLSLFALDQWAAFWPLFGLTGLFIALVVLSSVIAIASLRSHWPELDGRPGLWVFFALIQAFVLLYSLATLFLIEAEQVLGGSVAPAYFVIRNLSISLIVSLFLVRYLLLQKRWQSQMEAHTLYRLNDLQSRIRPHFLFNTLNTISSLIHDHPDQAEQATMDLADLLRTGLKDESTHALSDELDLIRGYLRIEQLRLADRLYVEWELTDELTLDQQLPPLLLQPLVENAIIHGISRRAEGGTLRIEGQRIRFGRIRFTVTNPLADPDSRPAEGNQSALENIRQRLALAYEERYGLKTWIEDGHFIAELTIPVT